MYGVNWPNEDIDYAAEAAKRNVNMLGLRLDELERENSRLRTSLKIVMSVQISDNAGWKEAWNCLDAVREAQRIAKEGDVE